LNVIADHGDGGSSGSGNSGEDGGDRDVTATNNGNNVVFESSDANNKIKFTVDVSSYPQFRFKWYNTPDATDNEYEYEVRAGFRTLIEYLENGILPGYTIGEAQVTQELSSWTWSAVTCTTGTNQYDCTFQSTGANAGVLSFAIHLAGQLTAVQGVSVRPTSLKLDVILNKANKGANNRLALEAKLTTKTELEQREETESTDEQDGVTTIPESQIGIGANAFFSWVEYAVQGGANITVFSSHLAASTEDGEDRRRDHGDSGSSGSGSGSGDGGDGGDGDNHGESESTNSIYFSFDTTDPAPIYWDPKIGTTGANSPASVIIPSITILLAFLALLL